MADFEYLKNRGRLAEKELEKKELTIKIENLVEGLRNNLDPFEAPQRIKGDRIVALAIDLSEKLIDYKEKIDEIDAIKKALGAK